MRLQIIQNSTGQWLAYNPVGNLVASALTRELLVEKLKAKGFKI